MVTKIVYPVPKTIRFCSWLWNSWILLYFMSSVAASGLHSGSSSSREGFQIRFILVSRGRKNIMPHNRKETMYNEVSLFMKSSIVYNNVITITIEMGGIYCCITEMIYFGIYFGTSSRFGIILIDPCSYSRPLYLV